jgi:two-component system sensor histidine kinase BaeS
MLRAYRVRLAATFLPIVALAVLVPRMRSDDLGLMLAAVLALTLALAGSIVHGRRVVETVNAVARFADLVADGELDARVAVRGGDELSELAASVNRMGARLAREGQERASFIGKVSHELRTPLTVIRGFAHTMARSEDDPDRAAKLAVIDAECERLTYLIEDLLELSRARAGEIRLSAQTFPLRDCVEEVAHRMAAVAEQHDVAIDVRWSGNGALVMGDENRVRQVFANLLTNGIKYAPPGSAVRVVGDSSTADLHVTVEDDGRGIPRDALPHIFDEFYQAPNRSEPGAGLGLAVARELTEAHGGRIEVRSAPGEGTAFTVTLPAWEPA